MNMLFFLFYIFYYSFPSALLPAPLPNRNIMYAVELGARSSRQLPLCRKCKSRHVVGSLDPMMQSSEPCGTSWGAILPSSGAIPNSQNQNMAMTVVGDGKGMGLMSVCCLSSTRFYVIQRL